MAGGFGDSGSEKLLVVFEGGFHVVKMSTQGTPRAPRSHRDGACTGARLGDLVMYRGGPVQKQAEPHGGASADAPVLGGADARDPDQLIA